MTFSQTVSTSLLPSSPEPEVEVFRMAANIPGRNRAVFLLTYEELLQRRLGRYEHVTSLRPLQLVSRLSLDVTIVDHSPIMDLQVPPLRNGRSSSGASSTAAGPNATKIPGSDTFYYFISYLSITYLNFFVYYSYVDLLYSISFPVILILLHFDF